MPSIEVEHISKTFLKQRAVEDVSFTVEPGEIFGLLGPNGAGKTTTIRIILDIFKPDSGRVSILGGAMTEAKKDRIGYLPEERGLYQDIPLMRGLVYLAMLKGLSAGEARRHIEGYLERFDLAEHRKKKIKELSKGMQQKAQLIITLVHNPELVIIDEPFSSLDPLNTQMVKDLLREERASGKAIVMSSHQLHLVEELCDRLVLINQGRSMLYGRLDEIRRRFATRTVLVRSPKILPAELKGVEEVQALNGIFLLKLAEGTSAQNLLRQLIALEIPIEQFELATPTLDEIFIQVVKGEPASE